MKKLVVLISLFLISFTAHTEAIDLSTLNGEKITYEKLVSNAKTVLFVWTTWCPSCIKEIKRLSKECVSIKDIDMKYLNVGQSASKVKKFVVSNKIKDCISNKILLDTQSIIAQLYGISGVPTYIFLKDGKPIYKSYFFTEKLAEMVFQNN